MLYSVKNRHILGRQQWGRISRDWNRALVTERLIRVDQAKYSMTGVPNASHEAKI